MRDEDEKPQHKCVLARACAVNKMALSPPAPKIDSHEEVKPGQARPGQAKLQCAIVAPGRGANK